MGNRLDLTRLRAVSEEERATIKRLARSRTAPARTGERAQGVEAAVDGVAVDGAAVDGVAVDGAAVEDMATQLHTTPYNSIQLPLARATVSLWLHRFEERGIAGLQDHPRGGRPPTYSREPVSQISATALSDPQKLGLP